VPNNVFNENTKFVIQVTGPWNEALKFSKSFKPFLRQDLPVSQ